MKVVALVSGGKDSCFNMLKCAEHGHEVVALANLHPAPGLPDELDSFCFQTVGHQALELYPQCTGLPLYRLAFDGVAAQRGLQYTGAGAVDEVEHLHRLLAYAAARHPDVAGVSSGAIASDYQRLRVEHVCARLGLTSLAYMWHQPQRRLLQAMLDARVDAVLVKVAALGLHPARHLGRSLRELQPHLLHLESQFGCSACGEGGEYETLTLACPAFSRGNIVVEEWETQHVNRDAVCPVAALRPHRFHFAPAPAASTQPSGAVVHVPEDWLPEAAHVAAPLAAKCSTAGITEVEGDSALSLRIHCTSCCTSAAAAAEALQQGLLAITLRLRQQGLDWGAVLFVHLALRDLSHFGVANAAYCAMVPQAAAPARACVQLPLPAGVAAAVEVLVATDSAAAATRRTLHVQSVSEWAPACVGPYSQATQCSGLLCMAGQIPLDAPTMQVLPLDDQLEACVRHCDAVATSMACDVRSSLLSALVFHTAALPHAWPAADTARLLAPARQTSLTTQSTSDHGPGAPFDLDTHSAAAAPTLDAYLRVRHMTAALRPLVLALRVPALPKGCAAEVQATCAVPPAAGNAGVRSESSSSAGDQRSQEDGSERVRRVWQHGHWPTVLQRTSARDDNARLHCDAFYAPGAFMLAHVCCSAQNAQKVAAPQPNVLAMRHLLEKVLNEAAVPASSLCEARLFVPIAASGFMDAEQVQEGQQMYASDWLAPALVPVDALSAGSDSLTCAVVTMFIL